MAKPRTYAGREIEITFDASRCIHKRNCFLKLPEVFDPARRPWVDPDAAPAEEIAAMVRTCPSGALSYRRTDGGAGEAAPGINRAEIWENGPLRLHGRFVVDGEEVTRVTLCRCGASENKPFCDHAHVKAGFEATGEPPATGKEEGGARGGAVEIVAHENGPLEARGPLELVAGTGGRVHVGTRMFLCRCVRSANKPFCDGSHKQAGFVAPGPRG